MRKTSHTQNKEPFLEYLLSWIRINTAMQNIKSGSKVCDLGCGYKGNFLTKISGKISLGEGYDISVAKKGFPENISLLRGNLNQNFAKRKNYFDYVTALAVLEHVENPKNFVLGAKKMLKKNGLLIITTPHARSKKILEFLSSIGIISKDEIKDHKNYFDEKSIKNLLRNSGLKVKKIMTFEMGVNILAVAKKA